jgi:hypothetical protein
MPVTDFVETTEALLNEAVEQLETYESWNVEKFPGTNYDELFQFLPALSLPAAVVVFEGSSFANRPRRTARIAVIALVESFTESASARTLMDKSVELLDDHILNQARFRALSQEAADFGPGISVCITHFEIEDH